MKTTVATVPVLVALAVVSLSLGGLGGSWQLSRFFLLPLVPMLLLRLWMSNGRTPLSGQVEIIAFSVLILAMAGLSIIWSVDKAATIGYVAVLVVNLAPLAMLGLLSAAELCSLRRLLPIAWMGAACLSLPLAAYELLTGNHFALGLDERGGGVVNALPFASGLHGNFNDFSLFLVFCLFGVLLASGAARGETPSVARRLAGPVVLALLAVVLVNTSRGAILTAAGLLLARYIGLLRLSNLPLVLLAVLLTATLALTATADAGAEAELFYQYLLLKFTDFSSDFDVQEGGRLAILQAGLQGLSTSVGLGVGAGANSTYLAYATDSPIPNPHNLLLEWALNFSIYGLLLLVWFAWRLWRIAGKPPQTSNTRLARAFLLLMPLFGVIQSHLTGYTYFWLALATAAAFAMQPTARPTRTSPPATAVNGTDTKT